MRSFGAVKLAQYHGVRVTDARRRLERADRRCGRPRSRDSSARRRGEPVGDRLVRADAAVTINGLVRWTINRGYAGLEAWAGTPGTVGGAIYGNAHWKQTNIGELVESVRLVKPDGTLLQAPADRMEFDYDYSRLKHTGEIVLWAAFRVAPGADPAALRAVARESLAFRKRTQPLESPSAGCIFMNPDRVARPRAGGHSAVGRCAGRSRRAEGRGERRRARVADARELHH